MIRKLNPTTRAIAVMVGIVLAGVLAGCERAKTKLDREVDRLCLLDGGIHIYETVTLPKEDFGPDGVIFPQYRKKPFDSGRFGPDYDFYSEDHLLVVGPPSLSMSTYSIIRRSDGRTLGLDRSYARHGGDLLPSLSPDSTHSCEDILHPQGNLELQIFLQQGFKK